MRFFTSALALGLPLLALASPIFDDIAANELEARAGKVPRGPAIIRNLTAVNVGIQNLTAVVNNITDPCGQVDFDTILGAASGSDQLSGALRDTLFNANRSAPVTRKRTRETLDLLQGTSFPSTEALLGKFDNSYYAWLNSTSGDFTGIVAGILGSQADLVAQLSTALIAIGKGDKNIAAAQVLSAEFTRVFDQTISIYNGTTPPPYSCPSPP